MWPHSPVWLVDGSPACSLPVAAGQGDGSRTVHGVRTGHHSPRPAYTGCLVVLLHHGRTIGHGVAPHGKEGGGRGEGAFKRDGKGFEGEDSRHIGNCNQ